MKSLIIAWKYLNYLLRSKTKYSIHSPFVYKLTTEVINSKESSNLVTKVEALRSQLCKDNNTISITDLGAGSNINHLKTRKIKDIAKNSAKSQKYGQLLFRLCNYLQPKNSLELGTSLGISASYLALSESQKVYTLEGCPNTAQKARENIDSLQINNVEIVVGDFKETLTPTLEKIKTLDFGFLDGNHQQKPTIKYFEECLKYCDENSVLIFDDIHWSEGMENAWKYIKNHEKVFVSIDLFFVGIVFLNPNQKKEHFIIRY
ncbi:MAG: class I SAM-dependent methyltransferase [Flavobacteriales bacterium]|jgi:predicted O-methyltransferase YrrM|tara:strand:- start:10649 stop:11431 length:783 start_codon:yes stop_codon:yes gene_type:complete